MFLLVFICIYRLYMQYVQTLRLQEGKATIGLIILIICILILVFKQVLLWNFSLKSIL